MEYNLEPIVEYCMTEEEATSYKLGLLWLEIAKKIFPSVRVTGYSRKGDPRRSSLFKYCYKLQRESKNLLSEEEYKLYIAAQLQMFKSVEISGQHPMIGPWCLIGDKAWVRWRVWKSKYENVNKTKTVEDVGVSSMDTSEIKTELIKTKKHLSSKFLSEEEFKVITSDVLRWIVLGKVSGYYAVMSPWVKKYCDVSEVDLSFYKGNITPDVNKIFKDIFSEEFT